MRKTLLLAVSTCLVLLPEVALAHNGHEAAKGAASTACAQAIADTSANSFRGVIAVQIIAIAGVLIISNIFASRQRDKQRERALEELKAARA